MTNINYKNILYLYTLIILFTQNCIAQLSTAYHCEIANCRSCSPDNNCTTCVAGFTRNQNSTTLVYQCDLNNLSLPYCKLYLTTSCYQCEDGYYIRNSKCQSNICRNVTGCIQCNYENACISCGSGYTLEPVDGQCVTCNLPNCRVCRPSTSCDQCKSGYYRQKGTGACIPHSCNIENCVACFGNDTCGICISGFSVVNNICISCNITKCRICSSTNICQACFSLYTLANNICTPIACNKSNCVYCQTTNNSCTRCSTGFNLVSSNCVAFGCSVTNCISCYALDKCYECITLYQAKADVCISCNITYCYNCTAADTCITCIYGYSLSSNTCVAWTCNNVANCFNCSGNSVCGTCQSGHYLSNNTCKVWNCSNVANCASCSGNTVCGVCNTGYDLSSNVCTAWTCSNVANCATCSANTVCGTCQSGYDLSSNVCTAWTCSNVANCQTCSANNVCGACNNGYALDNALCRLFFCTLPHCISCSSDNICSSCSTNYTVSIGNNSCACDLLKGFQSQNNLCFCPIKTTFNTNKCTPCNITNCISCLLDNICSNCQATFFLKTFSDSKTTCYNCNIPNCQSCSAHSICSQCDGSYKLNTNATQCVTCTISNCKLCKQNEVCQYCKDGFNLLVSGPTTSCITCTLASCQKCSANQVCSQCSTGYILVSGACKLCMFPCKTCAQNLTCLTCSSPYGLTPNRNGECFTCNVPFCTKCSSTNFTICVTCETGYAWNNTLGKCVFGCTAYCSMCHETTCSACSEGYRLDNNTCVKCNNAPKCKQCLTNVAICSLCSQRFYQSGSECLPCAENCATCTGPTQCTTFKESSGQIAIVINGVAQPAVCDPGCKKCSPTSPSICLVCENGYSLSTNSVCVACDSKCKTCGSSPTTCTSCYGNAFFSAISTPSICLQCNRDSNCQTCLQTNPSECSTCPHQYYLQDEICLPIKCSLNCLSCSSLTSCTICKEGYSLSSQKTCLPCASSCRRCSSSSITICLDCGRKFYLSSTSTCISCSKNCQKCTELGCTQCQSGYFVNSTFNCSVACSYPCSTCDSVNSTLCKSCLAGFTFDTITNKCIEVLTCTDGCVTCPYGYFIDGNQCSACSVQNCARCSTVFSSCSLCKDGYFLASSTTCTKCPNGISKCTSQTFALSCSPGFTSFTTNIDFGSLNCVECTSPCKTCTSDPEQCDSCIDGYYMQGWKCAANFNFNFKLTFALSSGDFYSQYSQFLASLAKNLDGDSNSITIKNINQTLLSSSSTQQIAIQGIASVKTPSNSTASTTQYNNFQSSITSGRLIKGMRVVYSDLQVNGGQLLEEQKKQEQKEQENKSKKDKQQEIKQQEKSENPSGFLFFGLTVSAGFFGTLLIAQCLYLRCKLRKPSKPMQMEQIQQMNEDPTSNIVLGYYSDYTK